MTRTALSKAIDHLAKELADRFRAAGLWDVVPPRHPLVSTCACSAEYRIEFEVLVSASISVRLFFEIGKDFNRDVIEGAAAEAVKVVDRVRRTRAEVLRMIDSARRIATGRFAPEATIGFGPNLINVRLAPVQVDRPGDLLAIEVDYHGLDDRLRLVRSTVRIENFESASRALDTALVVQRRRSANRRRVIEANGAGLIDAVSLAGIETFAPRPREFLQQVAEGCSVNLDLPYDQGSHPAPQWKDGVAGVHVRVHSMLSFGRGCASVGRKARDLDVEALAGRPLASIFEHPLLPPDLIIQQAEWYEGWPELRPGPDEQKLLLTYEEPLRVFDRRGDIVA